MNEILDIYQRSFKSTDNITRQVSVKNISSASFSVTGHFQKLPVTKSGQTIYIFIHKRLNYPKSWNLLISRDIES